MVFDVVVQDGIQFLCAEPVVPRQYRVDFCRRAGRSSSAMLSKMQGMNSRAISDDAARVAASDSGTVGAIGHVRWAWWRNRSRNSNRLIRWQRRIWPIPAQSRGRARVAHQLIRHSRTEVKKRRPKPACFALADEVGRRAAFKFLHLGEQPRADFPGLHQLLEFVVNTLNLS